MKAISENIENIKNPSEISNNAGASKKEDAYESEQSSK